VAAPVGIVVATRNRRADLLRALARHAAAPERPPVVVVDNASTDGSPAAVRTRHPDVEVIALPENRGAAARTVGVRLLRTPVVAFSDDDSWWAPGALGRIAAAFDADPDLGLVAGRILVADEGRVDPTCAAMAASPLAQAPGRPGTRVLGFVACGAAVRRSAYLAAGGFHPRLMVGGEETLLALDLAAAGWRLAYREDVVAHHHPRPDASRDRREATVLRNRLWAAWLRRPPASALHETVVALRGATPAAAARALPAALRGAGWVARARHVIPPAVAADLALLDGQQASRRGPRAQRGRRRLAGTRTGGDGSDGPSARRDGAPVPLAAARAAAEPAGR
jgi:GT2 family glycosyltransferase